MNLWLRFCGWCAAPTVAADRENFERASLDLQREAYRTGFAQGEVHGRNCLLGEFQRYFDERRVDKEVTEADVERAKKGSFH